MTAKTSELCNMPVRLCSSWQHACHVMKSIVGGLVAFELTVVFSIHTAPCSESLARLPLPGRLQGQLTSVWGLLQLFVDKAQVCKLCHRAWRRAFWLQQRFGESTVTRKVLYRPTSTSLQGTHAPVTDRHCNEMIKHCLVTQVQAVCYACSSSCWNS